LQPNTLWHWKLAKTILLCKPLLTYETLFKIKWYQYPAFIDLRDTLFTIKWDQYPAFIDLREFDNFVITFIFYKGWVLISFYCKYSVSYVYKGWILISFYCK
jgi:hypothetical protein